MSDSSARLALPYILPAQAQKHVTHNEAIERLDLLVQMTVEAFNAETPPTQPVEGAVWALGGNPTGDWAGQGGRIAARTNGGWLFLSPQPGWTAAVGADLRIWDGSAWVSVGTPLPDSIPGVGINTSYDSTNRLSVSSDATLFTHDGAGHQMKLNKQASTDTASLLFQTDWSGRAEMGTAGSDSFEIKVSANGTTWHSALQANPANGRVTFANGATIDTTVTGLAVVQSSTDTTAGRLLTTGAGAAQAFRRGNILGTVSQSGGVPTGAIIETGSNANGRFVRFADGTQICWHSITTSGTDDVTWTFPAAFASAPEAFGAMRSTATPLTCTTENATGSQVGINGWRTDTSARVALSCAVEAKGRWF